MNFQKGRQAPPPWGRVCAPLKQGLRHGVCEGGARGALGTTRNSDVHRREEHSVREHWMRPSASQWAWAVCRRCMGHAREGGRGVRPVFHTLHAPLFV